MFEKEYALLKLFEEVQRVKGRKKLQKTVYLLQISGIPFNMKYKYHYYGPYSAELQSQVDALVDYSLLMEKNNGDAYIYEITDKGREFIQKYREKSDDDISLPIELIDYILAYPATVLELASTYAYLIDMGYTNEMARTKALELKPHLKGYIATAEKLYSSLANGARHLSC